MKEKLFEILHNRKRMPGERFGDIEGKIEHLVNQEVERRIKERMPSEEECREWAEDETVQIDGGDNKRITFYLMVGAKWLRSRLTPQVTPQDTPQVEKTEGGGE